jgi:transposase InsO family protein
MGLNIQFESHRVELAGICEMEHDSGVLEYYDQPPAIKLDYESAAGKRMGVLHTPDFFVIREEEAGWEEWKTEEHLRRLSERNPNRYRSAGDGRWYCPPGTEYAERLGLYYRVRSSAEIDWVFQRNIQFLEDYLRAESCESSPACRDCIVANVKAKPGLTLDELLQLAKDVTTPDEIYAMIAADILHVDWRAAPLVEPAKVRVFPRFPTERTIKDIRGPTSLPCTSAALQSGTQVKWDGRLWRVVNLGDTSVSLLSAGNVLTEIPASAFQALVTENRLTIIGEDALRETDPARDRLSRASESDLKVATHRSDLIRRYLDSGTLPPKAEVPERTFFRWLGEYRQAETAYGNGFSGLLPRCGDRGNRAAKLPEASRRLMHEHIDRDYETLKQKTRYASWIQLKLACDAQATPAPSYKTFCLAVSARPTFDQTLKRQGQRASYQVATFYWNLDLTTPRHGDRPFEIAHMDHTELDVECVTASGQSLGRPWMTLLTDAYSRRSLAFYLTFDPPSYRSCMMVLRECVRRFGRLPQILVVDGGREFQSTYFEAMLARYECVKKTRPPASARFGSVLERMFGVANTQFIHNLSGNTQITRNVRKVTKAVDPKSLAAWPLAELHAKLSEYLYQVRDRLSHQALGQSPREAFESGLARTGARAHRAIAYNEEFLMLTLPTSAKGTARVMPSTGIKIHYIYYWCEAFRQIEGKSVPVRYDPFNAGTAYAFVRGQWLQCHSDCYGTFKGRSQREIMLATAELRRRYQNHSAGFHITARRLAEFLQSVESEEALLAQRLRDGETRTLRSDALSSIEGGTSVEGDAPIQSIATVPSPLDEESVSELYGVF